MSSEARYLAEELAEARSMLCEARRLLEQLAENGPRELATSLEIESWIDSFDQDPILSDMLAPPEAKEAIELGY